MDDEQPEPSYAYLLHNNEERVCNKDIKYCTLDEDGHPIPFCFQYPDSKSCLYNTQPPGILFMGCYDDPTCDGKPIGKIQISSKDPPFAYTIDGKCARSGELCSWLTDKLAVPKCVKEGVECRDKTTKYLVGCYTEKTCGGNVTDNNNGGDVVDENNGGDVVNENNNDGGDVVDDNNDIIDADIIEDDVLQTETPSNTTGVRLPATKTKKKNKKKKNKQKRKKVLITLIVILVLVGLSVFFYIKRKKITYSIRRVFQSFRVVNKTPITR